MPSQNAASAGRGQGGTNAGGIARGTSLKIQGQGFVVRELYRPFGIFVTGDLHFECFDSGGSVVKCKK